MINYEFEYNKSNKRIIELSEKMDNKYRMLREMSKELVEKDAVIDELNKVDHRACLGWKVACIGLSIYILITMIL